VKWTSDFRSCRHVKYDANYYQGVVSISGNYDIGHRLIFDSITVGDVRPGVQDPNIVLVDNGEIIPIRDIEPSSLIGWGAERNPFGDMVSYSLYPDKKVRPYGLSCNFKGGKVVYFDFGLTKEAESCPFAFSINSGPEFRFPISQKELEKILGKPESITKNETLTLP
jgi:hypothetical protein